MTVRELARSLPGASTLRDRSRVLAALDAVVRPDWEARYYSYDAGWGDREQLASMRTGSGDDYSIVFAAEGVFVRGFDHESPMSPKRVAPNVLWPGVVDGVPSAFQQYVEEPSFSDGVTPLITVCLWQLTDSGQSWGHGDVNFPEGVDDADGANWLFSALVEYSSSNYLSFADRYYEVRLPSGAVEAIYDFSPLTRELAQLLNPEVSFEEIVEGFKGIDYPIVV